MRGHTVQSNGVFHARLGGAGGQVQVIEVSSNLLDWSSLRTSLTGASLFDFLDINADGPPVLSCEGTAMNSTMTRVIFPSMNSLSIWIAAFVLWAGFPLSKGFAAEPHTVIELWPNGAPGEKGDIGAEKDTTKPTNNLIAGKPLIRLGNVSKPTISIYRPSADKNTGTAVLVCPGGGYHILAWDLEGTEVCEWLNSIGVTGVLLKYRVPKRANLDRHAAPLQDAQRALGVLRHRAKEFGIDPNRIGALGFSAGGHLAAALSANCKERTYSTLDEADQTSCRPDFVVLIYPGYLTLKEQGDKVAPELAITTNTPPTFLTMAQDDPVRAENVLFYALALKQANVPVELHLYPSGGHGYGLRRTKEMVTTWPERAADWMRSRGLLKDN